MGDPPLPRRAAVCILPYPSTHALWPFPSGLTRGSGDEMGPYPDPGSMFQTQEVHRMAASLSAPGAAFGIILSTHSFCSWRRGSSQEPDS